MPRILIPNPEDIFNLKYLPFIQSFGNHRTIILEGGRGSGKSHAIAQALVLRSLEKRIRILLIRKVYDTIRDSMFQEIKDIVYDWNLDRYFKFQGHPLAITNIIGSRFLCRGLDKSSKIKSIANIDIVWIEEATELTEEDYFNISLTIRGQGNLNVEILSFNREADHWTEKYFFNDDGTPKDNHYHIYTTYKDNKFLDKRFIETLENLNNIDSDLYRRHALGLPVRLKDIVFTHWNIVDEIPEKAKLLCYGMDFGYSEPTALVAMYKHENNLYFDEILYRTHLTTNELCQLMDNLLPPENVDIYADSAEPDRIKEIYQYKRKQGRFNIYPVEKGKNSVNTSLDILLRYSIFVSRNSLNLIKEIKNYKYKRDMYGNILDEPIQMYDHAIDAMRYCALGRLHATKHNTTKVLFEV